MIRYEYPLNERVRTLLRLEDLFERMNWYAEGDHPFHHHAALLTLFEIADVADRSDVKTDLLQELERQRATLSALRGNPDVELGKLDNMLREIELVYSGIHRLAGRIGQHLKEDEWLNAVRQRAVIPGGLCEFDLPGYHRWLHEPAGVRHAAFAQWIAPLMPVRSAIDIVLRLLRESCRPGIEQAVNGVYQQKLEPSARPVQMIRIGVDEEFCCVPEISANKYMLNIRFVHNRPGEARACADSLPFELAFCTL